MGLCSHGNIAPDQVILSWPICQAGIGRHKCAVCAYAKGVADAHRGADGGLSETCDQSHGTAPEAVLRALPISQAGLQRHRCVYRAYEDGLRMAKIGASAEEVEKENEDQQEVIESSKIISATDKQQLILARRGQGIFRRLLIERVAQCPVTGIKDERFLIASHIKPWRRSSNQERLDPYNGLLLAPQIDHLFDKGWITFLDNGTVKMSPHLPADIWTTLVPDKHEMGKPFSLNEQMYLDYHRKWIFRD